MALKRFIDDIAIEAIETKLIASLSKLFDPVTVFGMAPETVTRIAGETEEYRSMREHLNKKLDILNRGVETCKKFVGIRGIGRSRRPQFQNLYSSARSKELIDLHNLSHGNHRNRSCRQFLQ